MLARPDRLAEIGHGKITKQHRGGHPRCGGRIPYDVFWMPGRPDAIARDTLFKGPALSAPLSTLVT